MSYWYSSTHSWWILESYSWRLISLTGKTKIYFFYYNIIFFNLIFDNFFFGLSDIFELLEFFGSFWDAFFFLDIYLYIIILLFCILHFLKIFYIYIFLLIFFNLLWFLLNGMNVTTVLKYGLKGAKKGLFLPEGTTNLWSYFLNDIICISALL